MILVLIMMFAKASGLNTKLSKIMVIVRFASKKKMKRQRNKARQKQTLYL